MNGRSADVRIVGVDRRSPQLVGDAVATSRTVNHELVLGIWVGSVGAGKHGWQAEIFRLNYTCENNWRFTSMKKLVDQTFEKIHTWAIKNPKSLRFWYRGRFFILLDVLSTIHETCSGHQINDRVSFQKNRMVLNRTTSENLRSCPIHQDLSEIHIACHRTVLQRTCI